MNDRATEVLNEIRAVMAASSDLLQGHPVLLFGSRAAGTARDRSDFDIGVDGDAPLPLAAFYAISDKLEAMRTLYRIDWVDLCRAPDGFRSEALRTSKVLYHDTEIASR